MSFNDESLASHFLENISYYRLKGYWWDMQVDKEHHVFKDGSSFEAVIKHYNFDRHLRLILFDALERIEIALRTKLIHFMSEAHGPLWFLEWDLFENTGIHIRSITSIYREVDRSNEIFIKEHKAKHKNDFPESWKAFEVLSFGDLSRLYKNIQSQLPEKAKIAQSMGFNLHSELSSWLESFVYVRNVIAHHSRLWGRNLVKQPKALNNPKSAWLDKPTGTIQRKKSFLIISALVYVSNHVSPGHTIKDKIIRLMKSDPTIPIHSLGFTEGWEEQELWM